MPYSVADHAEIPKESGYGSSQLRGTTHINSGDDGLRRFTTVYAGFATCRVSSVRVRYRITEFAT